MRVIIDVSEPGRLSDALAAGLRVMSETKWDDWKVGYGWGVGRSNGPTYWVYRTKTGVGIRENRT